MNARLLALLLAGLLTAGCGGEPPKDDGDGGTAKRHAAGHGHDHATPHHGELAHVKVDGKTRHVEVKLHDDKGDIELWLYRGSMEDPWDVSPDTGVVLRFPDLEREAALHVRNRDRNEGEDGSPHMRDGKTNYFIFPGNTDADASWLVGKSFSAKAVLELRIGDKVITSDAFTLKPHVH